MASASVSVRRVSRTRVASSAGDTDDDLLHGVGKSVVRPRSPAVS
jgi:hypothetical protein